MVNMAFIRRKHILTYEWTRGVYNILHKNKTTAFFKTMKIGSNYGEAIHFYQNYLFCQFKRLSETVIRILTY